MAPSRRHRQAERLLERRLHRHLLLRQVLAHDSRNLRFQRLGLGLSLGHPPEVAPACQALNPTPERLLIATQRSRCQGRQHRTKLPEHLLAQVDAFIAGPLPDGPAVPLTGEYTPMNLLTRNERLAAMFDFGDGLLGPRHYDWLGPLTFLCAGQRERVAAYYDGYGERPNREERLALMRLLVLHRYSNLRVQIAAENWHEAGDFAVLAERLFA